MKLAGFLVMLVAGLFSVGARADYVDEAEDLSAPLTESEAENHPLWDSVGQPDAQSDELDLDEMHDLQIQRGDTLSEVQEVED